MNICQYLYLTIFLQLKNPPVVVLDEATSALDTITELSVQEALNTLGQHRTVIVIAHRLSTIMNADQIVVMDEGAIVEKGTHEDLLQISNGLYASLWQRQFKSDSPEIVSTRVERMDKVGIAELSH
mmetsp:Transcript_6670/g.10074  ORF Transcript_6670/g.10074 Transcript_6670/m.10074 type:complete len:126 (+) Transcript_6670:2132-2509(+)